MIFDTTQRAPNKLYNVPGIQEGGLGSGGLGQGEIGGKDLKRFCMYILNFSFHSEKKHFCPIGPQKYPNSDVSENSQPISKRSQTRVYHFNFSY